MIWIFLSGMLALLDGFSKFMLMTYATRSRDLAGREVPAVSVLIAAHNEEQNLLRNLPSILDQNYAGEWEVWVILDRCSDQSLAVVKNFQLSHTRLRYLRVEEAAPGISPKKEAIRRGIEAASHEWLLFTDADCTAGPEWITQMSGQMTGEAEIILGIGGYQRGKGLLGLWQAFETWWTATQYMGLARMGHPYMGVGRNLAYKKSLFTAGKGFSEHAHRLSGDDDLFVNQHATARNTRVVTEPASVTWSVPKSTWKGYFYQKLRHFSAGTAYKPETGIILTLLNSLQILFFLSLFPAGCLSPYPGSILIILLVRWLLFATSLEIIQPPFRENRFWIAFPLLDLLLLLYHLIIAPAGFIFKPKWKAD